MDGHQKAARGLIGPEKAIKPKTPVGMLSDTEIGRIVSNVLVAWIATRADQAVKEGRNVEAALRSAPCDGNGINPWDAGTIHSILPELAEQVPIDWDKPFRAWSRDEIVVFLSHAGRLIQIAKEARERAR